MLRNYRLKGILIDTNILLLYYLGNYNPNKITEFKRTSSYTREDFFVLKKLLSFFEVRLTTPNILTEISNLSKGIPDKFKKNYYEILKKDIDLVEEKYLPSKELSRIEYFEKIGLTDSSIIKIAQQEYLILTDDFPLYNRLLNMKLDVINCTHIRTIDWFK
jgi:rRNA-processing protein FCF1